MNIKRQIKAKKVKDLQERVKMLEGYAESLIHVIMGSYSFLGDLKKDGKLALEEKDEETFSLLTEVYDRIIQDVSK